MNNNTVNDFTHFQNGIRENMRQALRDAGLSQQQLAERLSKDKSHVSNILHGKENVSLNFLWKFANDVCSGDLYSLLPESATSEDDPILQYADELFRHARHANSSKSYQDFEDGIRGRLWEAFQSENLSYNALEKN